MDDLKKRQTAFQEYRAAWVVLDKNPTEPAANLAAGRYLCFVKGDWDRGVPMLALGSDAKLKDVAVKDLRGANSAEEQAAIGDAWWELAETQQGSERDLLRLRAGFWYQQAEPKLAGELAGLKIKQRLAELKKGDRDIPTVASKATPPSAALPREQLLAGTILIMTFEPDTFTSRDGKIYVTDLSSCENHGVLEGPAQTPMGRAGASLQLGGRGCVLLPTLRGRLTQELKQLSLSLWVLQSDLTGSQIVFDVGFSGSRSISLVCHDSEFEFILPDHYGGKALRVLGRGVPGQWRHVVGVWNGGEQRVYVDGVVRAVSATQGLTLNARSISEETARLGAQAKPDHRSERYFRGAIDEVAVFDRALSEEEIQTLIQLGKRGEPLVKAVRSRAGR
jgi:hypothetical protein